jgi:hypothetical protein
MSNNLDRFKRPDLNVKSKEQSKFDAIAELKKESFKRTNLSAPTSLLNLVSSLKDYLMRENGKKPTLEDLYFEALVDIVKKYHLGQGDKLFEDKVSFDKYFKMMFPEQETKE